METAEAPDLDLVATLDRLHHAVTRSFMPRSMLRVAQYIGSSRTLVGLCLVEFRHQQLLGTRRKEMVLYRDSLRE